MSEQSLTSRWSDTLWQSIQTAPKDEIVLVAHSAHEYASVKEYALARWDDKKGYWVDLFQGHGWYDIKGWTKPHHTSLGFKSSTENK